MSQFETTNNLLTALWKTIPTTDHPIRTSSLPAATTTTAPEIPIMKVSANIVALPANSRSEGPYDVLIPSAIQAASDAQEQMGSSSPLSENHPAANSSAPRHYVDSIWPESEAVSSAEAHKDEGCGLKHFFWVWAGGISNLCCMT